MTSEDEPRYYHDYAPSLGTDGLLEHVSKAVGETVAGIVDEQAGGIVAYVIASCADEFVTTLNRGADR